MQKVCTLDDNVCMAFTYHTADVRIVNRAWVECQSHQLTMEDFCGVHHLLLCQSGAELHTEQWVNAIWHLCPNCEF